MTKGKCVFIGFNDKSIEIKSTQEEKLERHDGSFHWLSHYRNLSMLKSWHMTFDIRNAGLKLSTTIHPLKITVLLTLRSDLRLKRCKIDFKKTFDRYLVLAHKFVQSVMRFVSCLLHGPEIGVIPFGYFDKTLPWKTTKYTFNSRFEALRFIGKAEVLCRETKAQWRSKE